MARRKAAIASLLAPLLLSACTTITIQSDGHVESHLSFGLRGIDLVGASQPVVVTTKGVGAVAGSMHLTLGWLKEELVLFPDSSHCRLLIYLKSPHDLEEVLSLLRDSEIPSESFCLTKGS